MLHHFVPIGKRMKEMNGTKKEKERKDHPTFSVGK
jgi:hypothetical protein